MNNHTQEKKKLGFFDQMACSVQPAKYGELLEQSKKKVIGYLLLLVTLLTIMEYVIPAAGWITSFGGIDNLFLNVLPKIEFSQGELSAASKIEIGKDSTVHILVDTSVDEVKASELDTDTYLSEILIGKKNMILYSSYAGAAQLDFANYKAYSFNNENLLSLKPWIYAGLVLTFFTTFLGQLIYYLVVAIPFAALEWLMRGIERERRIGFFKVYKLTIYAKTAAALIVSFNNTAGLIENDILLVYGGMLLTMFLLMTGVRKTEAKVK